MITILIFIINESYGVNCLISMSFSKGIGWMQSESLPAMTMQSDVAAELFFQALRLK